MTTPYYEALRARWELVKKCERDAYKPAKIKRIRSSELVAELKDRSAVTGDRRFLDAVKAIEELDEKKPDWRRARVAAHVSACIARVDGLRRRDEKLSVRSLAARVAVQFVFTHSDNFDAAVTRLERAYDRATREMREKGFKTIAELSLGKRLGLARRRLAPEARKSKFGR